VIRRWLFWRPVPRIGSLSIFVPWGLSALAGRSPLARKRSHDRQTRSFAPLRPRAVRKLAAKPGDLIGQVQRGVDDVACLAQAIDDDGAEGATTQDAACVLDGR